MNYENCWKELKAEIQNLVSSAKKQNALAVIPPFNAILDTMADIEKDNSK